MIFGAQTLRQQAPGGYLFPGQGGVGTTTNISIGMPCPVNGTITEIKAYHGVASSRYGITYTVSKNGTSLTTAATINANQTNSTSGGSETIDTGGSSTFSAGDIITVTHSGPFDLGAQTVYATLVLSFQPT